MRIKNILVRFCNSGYDEPVYDLYCDGIAEQNKRMVQAVSFVGSVMMLLLTAAAFVVPTIGKVLPLYLFTAALFGTIYVIVQFTPCKSSTTILLCNYLFLLAAFFFALALDAIQKNPTATTVCVLLVALPLLVVDKPWREFLVFLVMSVCFMFESVYVKQSPKASIDVLNAMCFLIVGAFLGYKHNQMMLRNLRWQSRLEHQRDTDALTNLYNKRALEVRARAFLEQQSGAASLFIIDMDNFKYVNDTYGHHSGDELLAQIGERLSATFRSSDYLCRFGGDEFVVFLPMVHEKKILKDKAEQILQSVQQLRIAADAEYRAHVCIGIARCPQDGTEFEKLFKSADSAMYRVKKNGKNGYAFCDTSIRHKILLVDDIELNRAVLKKALSMEYEVLEAEDGVAAMKILAENTDIAMVITDIQMPRMDGIELIQKIRADEKYDNVAIIANTQHGDLKQESHIISLGVDEFIYKAAAPGVIQMRVKNVIRAREI